MKIKINKMKYEGKASMSQVRKNLKHLSTKVSIFIIKNIKLDIYKK